MGNKIIETLKETLVEARKVLGTKEKTDLELAIDVILAHEVRVKQLEHVVELLVARTDIGTAKAGL